MTRSLDELVESVSDTELVKVRSLDPVDADVPLARHIAALTRKALRSVRGEPDERLSRQLEIVNRVTELLIELAPEVVAPEAMVAASSELLAIAARRELGGTVHFPERPIVPLNASALLMNGHGQPQIGFELQRELASTRSVDLLCAFVKWNGVRVLERQLAEFMERGGRLRVITTTYIGATDRMAVDRLVELGAQVRVSYETKMTRLHAKAWLFHRDNDLSTAYVGSSNLSKSALSHGLEWNVRLAEAEQPHLIDTFAATFDSYWDDAAFEPYDPARDGERLTRALAKERGGSSVEIDFAAVDVRPYPFQSEILDGLDAERQVHGRHRNLVVMATGTGKTIVAALDYRRLAATGQVGSLLFVAHRREILQQSRATFRLVMRDQEFGELLVGEAKPRDGRHVFASIQALSAAAPDQLSPDDFDMVIIDEFHHAEAPTYRALLDRLAPKELLGLTATPERADGHHVKEFFDGRIAVELRLWEAIERGLLAPFQYFGVHDGVDLRSLPWRRGYDQAALSQVYADDGGRVGVVLEALRRKVGDLGKMRALGFCVDVRHAEFMAARFNAAGVSSVAVTSATPSEVRAQALRDLRKRDIKVIFSVDLFNEGVDIPEVDTVLFLRPTDSATVFLQQLGRGLRLAEEKPCLTVLDFIGNQHRSFRFDRKLRALTGLSRTRLVAEVDEGFATLPAGCVIDLDRDVREIVLDNVKQALRLSWPDLARELRHLGDVPLDLFLRETGWELEDLYRRRGGWTALRRTAGLIPAEVSPSDETLGRAFGRMLHIDDDERLTFIADVLDGRRPAASREHRLLAMLDAALWNGTGEPSEVETRLARLLENTERCGELRSILGLLHEEIHRVTPGVDAEVPLRVHARYSKNEALAAFGVAKPANMREGVRWVAEHQADLLFVTIDKAEQHYSPTTLYHDRAITERLFQWESQSTLGIATPTAERYLNQRARGTSVHLFLRESKRDEGWGAPPYLYAGPMSYVSHERDRPIRIVWQLERALPGDVFHYAAVG
ncbi:superfamily II DNA or RNA helicase [Allocatelliglobosispora scoriae]|uniref:Superfamily II DNA or RNA helicase n=2 Tax=Allocatelliglobosispora scoriae TaxID=643052 RepID=A0A841BSQ0_9ACTN|nr:superfamily II DNA or RNA helicase [Allocatelliglobosispora scoriae]